MTIERSNPRRCPMRSGACAILMASVICMFVGSASGQTAPPSSAKKDFVLNCADCHGVDGKGNGPAVQVIPGFKPADLTRLSANHGGQFPRQEVYDVIDGRQRQRLPGHYDSDTDMPLWGMTFQSEGRAFSKESEDKVKARISALVDYIEGLQQK